MPILYESYAKSPEYKIAVGKKATFLDIKHAGPLSGTAPLRFTLHFTLNEVGGPGLNDKDCHLYIDGEFGYTVKSHGIFGWYGEIGWVNGCVDFDVMLDSGTHTIYAEFPGDAEYEGCLKSTKTFTIRRR